MWGGGQRAPKRGEGMKPDAVEVIVIGGGVGGLAAAAALAQAGMHVRLFERRTIIGEIGAGLQITPNGSAVLAALGLGEAAREMGVAARGVVLHDGLTGRVVMRLPVGQRLSSPHPWLLMHRADLMTLLHEAACKAGVGIETDAEVVRIAPDGRRAEVVLADGRSAAADLVIGADGVRSLARGLVEGDLAPRFTGQVAWRALVRGMGDHPPEPHVFMGPGRHMVSYPLRGGRLVNVVAVEERDEWVPEGWHQPDDPISLAMAFRGWCDAVRLRIEHVADVHLWGLFRHPVARRWARGRLVLVGDAAHPTLPFLAQGANMALEDAWLLRRVLAAEESVSAALARFAALRRPRAERIVAAADHNSRLYHLRHPLVRHLAHGALAASARLAPRLFARRYDWVHEYDATAAPLA